MEVVQETVDTVQAPEATEEQKQVEAIRNEYAQLCMKRGDLAFKAWAIDEEINDLMTKMHNLDLKHQKAFAKWKESEQSNA